MKTKALILLFFSLSFSLLTYAQYRGRPFIQNFSPRKYKGEGQNWDVIQDDRGMIYVSNSTSILEYDGVSWRKIEVPEKRRVAEFAKGPDGTIYSIPGAKGELGFLASNDQEGLHFQSMKYLIPEDKHEENPLRSVVSNGDHIFFLGRNHIYRWSRNQFKVIDIDQNDRFIGSIMQVGDRLIVIKQINAQKLAWYQLDPETLELKLLSNQSTLRKVRPIFFLPYHENKILIVGRNAGIHTYDFSRKGRIRKLNSDANQFIKENRLRHAIQLEDGNFVFGTTLGGLIVMDKRGKVLQHVDKSAGLLDNEVSKIYVDNQGGVWCTLGNGISRVELNSPISFWYDEVGGWTTTVNKHKGTVYVGSYGLHALTAEGFKTVSGYDRSLQSWHLMNFKVPDSKESRLLYGNSGGVFEVEGLEAELIEAAEGVNALFILQSSANPNRIYIGAADGTITVLKLDNDRENWELEGQIEGLGAEVRHIVEKDNSLWISTYYDGLKRVIFHDIESLEIEEIKNYTVDNGLPANRPLKVHQIDGEFLVTTPKGLYEYDPDDDVFRESILEWQNFFNEENQRGAFLLEEAKDDSYFVASFKTNNQPISHLKKNENGRYTWYDVPFKRVPSMEPEDILVDDDVVWIAGSQGLIRYDASQQRDYNSIYHAFIRRITIGEDSIFFNGAYSVPGTNKKGNKLLDQPDGVLPTFEYSQNQIEINYAAPTFDDNEDGVNYQYILEGYQDRWSDWTNEDRQTYTNLFPKEYTFKVRARNSYGQISNVAAYRFYVEAPWYFTIYAIVGYILTIGLFIFGIIKWNVRRLKMRNQVLEKIVEERTSEIQKQKNKIEKAYDNIQTIGEIGKKITSTLELENLIETVYQSVNSLVDASAFGVGVYNDDMNRLEFPGFIEKGEKLYNESDYLSDETKLSSWCFNNQEMVFINDILDDIDKYIEGEINLKVSDDLTRSIIYLPLMVENSPVGVFTVQSFKPNAYSELDLTILKTLASYVAIALSNTNSFRVIQEKNAQITDSIRYAETIQKAVLPSTQKMADVLHDFFVIWKPKDIVSGDFYWFNHVDDKIFFAVVDCTGHGVPGAFMSMIGASTLNDIINVKKVYSPADILELMHMEIKDSLQQHEAKNADGMDVAICCLEAHQGFDMKLTFAGAKMPMYFVKDGKFNELKGDRKAIGGMQRESRRTFTNHEVICSAGDSILLCSDGFIDQNDEDRRKIGSIKLKQVLERSVGDSPTEVKATLENLLDNHMEGVPQRDDITVIGIQF